MMIGSLLIAFVPQSCAGPLDIPLTCTIGQNMEVSGRPNQNTHMAGILLNFSTFFAFLLLYICEYRRENFLISHMDVNDDVAQDGKEVKKRMELLKEEDTEEIESRNHLYSLAFYFSALLFFINTMISYACIFKNANETTGTTFMTSVLFMLLKVVDVYSTVSAEDGVFISAYLRVKLQYNDVDDSVYSSMALEAKDSNASPEQLQAIAERAKNKKNRLTAQKKKQNGKKAANQA